VNINRRGSNAWHSASALAKIRPFFGRMIPLNNHHSNDVAVSSSQYVQICVCICLYIYTQIDMLCVCRYTDLQICIYDVLYNYIYNLIHRVYPKISPINHRISCPQAVRMHCHGSHCSRVRQLQQLLDPVTVGVHGQDQLSKMVKIEINH
jgi:hypothetical protein